MFPFSALPVLLLWVVTASGSGKTACEDAQKTCSVITCGIPVTNGTPGRDGRDGAKGEKGEPGTRRAALPSQDPTQGETLPWEGPAQRREGSPSLRRTTTHSEPLL